MEAWTWGLAGGNYGNSMDSSTVYPFSAELLKRSIFILLAGVWKRFIDRK